MIFAGEATEGSFATHYEQLRSRGLDGPSRGGHFGLVILLREGVAAWMAHAATRLATVVHRDDNGRPAAVALIADDVHTDMIAVLASMVMITTTHEERCA